jgi:hypothetical protein
MVTAVQHTCTPLSVVVLSLTLSPLHFLYFRPSHPLTRGQRKFVQQDCISGCIHALYFESRVYDYAILNQTRNIVSYKKCTDSIKILFNIHFQFSDR